MRLCWSILLLTRIRNRFPFKIIYISRVMYFILIYVRAGCSSPTLLTLLIVAQSLLIFVITCSLYRTWIGMAIVLIFSGGIIIVFLYITRLSSDYRTKIPSPNYYIPLIFIFSISMLFSPILWRKHQFNKVNDIAILFIFNNWGLMIFSIRYLILTLLFCVKTIEADKGTIKKIF